MKKVVQIDFIDDDLQNRLWSSLDIFYWYDAKRTYERTMDAETYSVLFLKLWDEYFKKPVDTLRYFMTETIQEIRKFFFEKASWYDIYDFMEKVVEYYPDEEKNKNFMGHCNSVLESEVSAYRFVGGKITQITSEVEISEIEEALEIPLKPVNTHLKTALDLLSNKKSPDYRNSIKESISAVESFCELISNKKIPLGQCLGEIETKIGRPIHGALRRAFESLYGYTSTAEGIRHALLDEPTLGFEDAKFMLVSCSAFINYLVSKASKAGTKMWR